MPNFRREPSPFTPVLAALGIRSFNAYARGVRHVDVERRGSAVEVTPSRNGGAKEGFVGEPDRAVVLVDPAPAALGAAVRDALAASA